MAARRGRASKAKANDGFVKVGDVIELEGGGNGLAVLPGGEVVTVRQRYTIQHEGLHTIDGTEYLAEAPEPAPESQPED